MSLSPEIEGIRTRLAYETPFWSGGMVKDSEGRWHPPGPQSFRGVAKILSEERTLIPLIGRPWQTDLDDALEAQRRAGQPMRAIICKARKLGMSTWGMAKITQRVTQFPYEHAVVGAQDVKTASVLFQMAELMYNHLPSEVELGLGFNIKPDLISANFAANGRKSMVFGERSRRLRQQGRTGESILEIDTANAPQAGRGTTPSMLWGSEVAWWENVNKLVGLLNAVPDTPDSLIVLESTANGLNHFHKRWLRAVEGAEDPEVGGRFVPIFAPWWKDSKYRMVFASDESRARFESSIGTGEYGADEPYLVESCRATPEQLLWRRTTIREKTENNVELFKQEFPANAEEAFIGSGRTVFSGVLISRTISEATKAPEPVRGSLRGTEFVEKRTRSGVVRAPTAALWLPESEIQRGEPVLDVWEHPITPDALTEVPQAERPPVGAYVVAVDVAEGEANTFSEGDFHAVQVFDHRSRMQVAVHESRMDIHLLPMWVLLICLYYNRAHLAVEVNGPGIAVTEPLAKDYRYPMYSRRRYETRDDPVQNLVGWKTDKRTKPIIEANFGEALQEGTHGIRHMRSARQLNTYVIDDRGRHGATEGEHDDLLVAAMIAHQVMDERRPPRTDRKKRRGRQVLDDVTGYGY